MKFHEMTDEQLIELAKIRFKKTEPRYNFYDIIVDEKLYDESHNEFLVTFIAKSGDWDDLPFAINFEKFWIEEIVYLQKIGIDFEFYR